MCRLSWSIYQKLEFALRPSRNSITGANPGCVCVCVYLYWRCKVAQPGKRRPACHPGSPQWTSEQQNQRPGLRWEGTTDPWSGQRSFRGTCGWTDLWREGVNDTV